MNDERPVPNSEDEPIAMALRSAEMPPELPARLLAAMRAARTEAEPPAELEQRVLAAVRSAAQSNRRTVTRRGWMLGFSAAAAAAVAVGGAWGWARLRRPLSLDGLVEELAAISSGGVRLALRTPEKTAIAAWMKEHSAPRAGAFPPALDALGRKGCQQYYVAGHPVSLECFELPDGSLIHLFCTGREELTDAPSPGVAPRVFAAHGHTAAAWTHGAHTIVILSHESPATIQPLLA
jgi:hypothetical protein